jgi:hypothetical protein
VELQSGGTPGLGQTLPLHWGLGPGFCCHKFAKHVRFIHTKTTNGLILQFHIPLHLYHMMFILLPSFSDSCSTYLHLKCVPVKTFFSHLCILFQFIAFSHGGASGLIIRIHLEAW